jgi:hypothetical protein
MTRLSAPVIPDDDDGKEAETLGKMYEMGEGT